MSLYHDIQELLKTSENSVETARAAIEAISAIHCKYCELFRNEIDNLWDKSDGRYKILDKFVRARGPFQAIIDFDNQRKKEEKAKAKKDAK